MARPFIDDLGPSPFKHRRRQKAAVPAPPVTAIKEEASDPKESCHDAGRPTEQLGVTPPPESTTREEGPASQGSRIGDSIPPITRLATTLPPTRDLSARKLLSWDGKDLGISPFKGRRRLQALVKASEASHSVLEKPTAVSSSPGSLNGAAHLTQDPQPSDADTETVSSPRSFLDSELEKLSLSSPSETTPNTSDGSVTSAASVSHAPAKNKILSLTVKKALTPQPFLNTNLGRVPPEVREIIWKYLLISSTSHIFVQNQNVDAQSQPESQPSGDSQLSSKATPSTIWSTQPFSPEIDLLRTCRLVREECQHIFYSKNSFILASASDLLGFLRSMGDDCRDKLRSLHLVGLITDKLSYTEKELDEFCREGWFGFGERDSLAQETGPDLHPHAEKATGLLRACKNLKTIDIEFKVGEELGIIHLLQEWHGFDKTAIDFLDDFSWIVRPTRFLEKSIWRISDAHELARPSDSSWGTLVSGNDRVVKVSILRGIAAPNRSLTIEEFRILCTESDSDYGEDDASTEYDEED